ncbi:hybrid cluster protein [Denitrovibrio acetiphilus DSM 12809]|uniref:Hydroxylamine reductase n=2 Tax=Denitrovibrio TaxID=117999 RepID=D4H7R2_DENA2|nr:hydroxylamine reductase [Denitrovibrio acetiphilus]ADD68061.1 hybrid cluster protein [Denitrovibrio acetiphilus DSM 12809]
MGMFCYQCQETAKNTGCTVRGVCGKTDDCANLQDALIYVLKGLSVYAEAARENGAIDNKYGRFITQALFATITNANFDNAKIYKLILAACDIRDELKSLAGKDITVEGGNWRPANIEEAESVGAAHGVLSQANEDVRSLRELAIYGVKGMAAYADHASVLGYEDPVVFDHMITALASTTKDLSVEDMIAMVMKTGETAVTTMALLDKANTESYGNPEITEVNIGVGKNPGILISGHDLKDLKELLEQTQGTGVDVYTHSEMLPAHYYPEFKKYDNFVGNYGNAWWKQSTEFDSFNGPILMTTNCITPVKDSYKDRMYTTGMAGYPGLTHIEDAPEGKMKNFSAIIEQAKKCPAPTQIEEGKIVGGFAHAQVMALADKVVDAVKSGAIKRFVVMAGCDGRHKERSYFTDVAEGLPKDAVILTAGCAKYRYNKLALGDIGGIPRVLDAGQCNDSYSLAVIALKLKEVFGLEDINELPISFDIAWYEQKAATVLLALLYLGVKGIRLGPTLPAFLSPNVAKVLVENFDIKAIGDVKADIDAMMAGV